ncbi:phospholipase D-like domain-containing protein [Haloferax namakaokahaiae]|uniref:Phospholipase D-like domain-containing protein n=1 Tax=Haloferax namakaokahaiae TaxID=1748331 RepID=A0ABD5ZC68_9EURY
MPELIYHDPTDRTGLSPFDRAIRDITDGEEVLLVCPYISPDYLSTVIEKTEEWFLLTDVGEWLRIHGQTDREAVRDFIVNHHDHVRHVPDIHAKVVVGDGRALVGSANFTKKGLTGRTEMSVLLDGDETVSELREWFETLWAIYDSPEIDRVESYIEASSPSPKYEQSSVAFSSSESPGTASLSEPTSDGSVVEDEDAHQRLVTRVGKAPSPEWAYSYFKLVGELLSRTGLTNDDPRLVMSLPQNGTLPVSVNNRYAVVAFRDNRSRAEFILPADTDQSDSYFKQADYTGRFDPLYGEERNETPWFVGFDGIPSQVAGTEFRDAWLSAVSNELQRAEKSPYRRYHEPVVFEAVRNRAYRERVIREAFEMG